MRHTVHYIAITLAVLIVAAGASTQTHAVPSCPTDAQREWVGRWEKQIASQPVSERLQKAVKEAAEAVFYPSLYASRCEQRMTELTNAATEFYEQEEAARSRLLRLILFGALFFVVLVLLIGSLSKTRAPADPDARRKQLRRELGELRLENDIEWEKARSQLLTVKVETKGAGLFKVRDERLLDAFMARQALNQVLGGGQRTIDANPLTTATAAISEEIENRKADGQDTRELEEVLHRLRGRS